MTVSELKDYLTQFPDEAKVVVNAINPEALAKLNNFEVVQYLVRQEATAVEIDSDYEVSIS